MAFAVRAQQQPAMEENAGKDAVKGAVASKAGSLLQPGGKRRAPLGDMSNLAGPLNARAASKDAATKAAEPVKPRALTVRSSSAKELLNAGTDDAQRQPSRPTTRAMARQQLVGPSMSSLLQSRSSEAATAKPTSALPSGPPASPLPSIDDASEHSNPLAATEYVNDIYSYFRRVEPKFRVQTGYMARQADINERMRAILIDWLVEVHLKFKLMPETLCLTVNLIDRFLESKPVTRKNLQLVGVTAMLIGSKYEEIWAPEVRDFVYISDKAYTREQILAMEKLMLNTLQFNLTLPTAHNFLARFIKAAGNDRKALSLATYLSELSMVDASMLAYSYSMVSAAALHVALTALEAEDTYPHALARHSGYSLQDIKPCVHALVKLMHKAPTHSLTAVHKKYCSSKHLEVAQVPPPLHLLPDGGASLTPVASAQQQQQPGSNGTSTGASAGTANNSSGGSA